MSRREAYPPLPAWRRAMRTLGLVLLFVIVVFGYRIASLYTDWLWFGELGRRDVFATVLTSGLSLYAGFGLLFFLIFYTNVWIARNLNMTRSPRLADADREQMLELGRAAARWGGIAAAIFLAFLAGGTASAHWSEYVLFTHASAGHFGVADPVFNNDVSFYAFRLPFLSFLQGWMLFTLFVTLIGAAVVHAVTGALEMRPDGAPFVAPQARRHLLVLAGCIAVVFAAGIFLGRYDLLTADNDQFIGAGYVDVHVRLLAMNVGAILMAITGLLCAFAAVEGRSVRIPVAAVAIWLVWSLVAGGLVPGVVQNFVVTPNQFDKERDYIARDIEMTRRAYNLDRVAERSFTPTGELSAADVAANQPTVRNVRLWDWPELGRFYNQKQSFRNYYRFNLPDTAGGPGGFNIDVDRYGVGGETRQVMLGARELNLDALDPNTRTWQNQRLQYTHGYGVVVSPANRVDPNGQPEFFAGGIPMASAKPELNVTHPQLYYGEAASDYVFVDTKQKELDYPTDQGNQETSYTGKGGVRLGGAMARLAWSMRLADGNMLLSGDLTDGSRILYRRNIRDRLQKLAPFLNWDNDPYLVVDGGRLVWMLDGYTVTDRFPYSKSFSAGTGVQDVTQDFNYIRNSVKATVDAYDGTVTLYAADHEDPILKVWQRIFPGMFKPLAQMPKGLLAHVRYPEDLFRVQRDLYCIYHIRDARIYYSKGDAWEVPVAATSVNDTNADKTPMVPYYVVMRLPNEPDEEFLIMTPFAPLGKTNIAAWMCAKCDPENYGELETYRFPKGTNVNGPQQIMAQVKQKQDVSSYLTLMGQHGSEVSFGNLLAIPVQSSLIYVVPVYLQAAGANGIPAITNVIVASGNHIEMRPTFTEALSAVMTAGGAANPSGAGRAAPMATGGAPPAAPIGTESLRDVVNRANAAYGNARRKQAEYGQALDDLGKALKELDTRLGR